MKTTVIAIFWIGATIVAGAAPSETLKVDFAHDILPIIKSRCAECHTNGTYNGGLSFDTRDATLKSKAIVPGDSRKSALIRRIMSSDPTFRMPPKGDYLTPHEVALFTAWIDQRLPWEEGFTFKREVYVAPLHPRRVSLPPARPNEQHPIDRILTRYFKRAHVSPTAPLNEASFIRRLHLDLIGLLPEPDDVNAFLRDVSPDKRTRLIRTVLNNNEAYADHWLTFWNDLLRNDYQGTGYIDGGRKQITRWLYQSLLSNKPYDQFVRELISPSAESEGFIKGIKWRGRVNASQVREVQFAQNVAQVFLGINLKCASCHDSFIDHWKLNDSYSMAAIIADEPLEIHRCDKPQGKQATARFLFPELGDIDPSAPKAQRLEQLSRLLTHPENGRFTRTIANRIWHRLMGHGIVHPVDAMGTKPWNEDLLDHLANYLSDNQYDLKKLIEHIVTSRAYQSRCGIRINDVPGEYVFHGPELKRMTAEQFMDAIWKITQTAPGKAVAPIADMISKPTHGQFVRASLVNCDLLMRSLGRPNREQVVTTRPDQLTTLQALDLENGEILNDIVSRGAENLLRENPGATRTILVEMIYLRALSRKPSPEELLMARTMLGDPITRDSLADFLWAILMLPEFQLIQ